MRWPQRPLVVPHDHGINRSTIKLGPRQRQQYRFRLYGRAGVDGRTDRRMGERIELLKPYQVSTALMQATGKPRARFMHCLPAYHNLKTETGRQIHDRFGLSELEVTDEVFESMHRSCFRRRKTACTRSRRCSWRRSDRRRLCAFSLRWAVTHCYGAASR